MIVPMDHSLLSAVGARQPLNRVIERKASQSISRTLAGLRFRTLSEIDLPFVPMGNNATRLLGGILLGPSTAFPHISRFQPDMLR